MKDAFIFDALRSPRGNGEEGGSLQVVKPVELASQVLKELLNRSNIPSPSLDDLILGVGAPVGEQGGLVAKACALHAGFSSTLAGVTINRSCASSLESVNLASLRISAGQDQLLIAGGLESMSRVPLHSDGGALMSDPQIAHNFIPQGVAADLLASLKRYSRRDLDQWAVHSHKKASLAQDRAAFKNSLLPIKSQIGHSFLSYDELVKSGTTMEGLANFEPLFKNPGFDFRAIIRYPELEKIAHLHHAGNISPNADGAAALLLGNGRMAKKYELSPRAKIRSFAVASGDSSLLVKGMNQSIKKALKQANLEIEDIDLFEIQESFSSVILNTIDEFKLDPEKINVNGGSIAFGHPQGATGAMLLISALDELEARNKRLALVSIGTFSGMGVTTIIERVDP